MPVYVWLLMPGLALCVCYGCRGYRWMFDFSLAILSVTGLMYSYHAQSAAQPSILKIWIHIQIFTSCPVWPVIGAGENLSSYVRSYLLLMRKDMRVFLSGLVCYRCRWSKFLIPVSSVGHAFRYSSSYVEVRPGLLLIQVKIQVSTSSLIRCWCVWIFKFLCPVLYVVVAYEYLSFLVRSGLLSMQVNIQVPMSGLVCYWCGLIVKCSVPITQVRNVSIKPEVGVKERVIVLRSWLTLPSAVHYISQVAYQLASPPSNSSFEESIPRTPALASIHKVVSQLITGIQQSPNIFLTISFGIPTGFQLLGASI